MTGGVTGCNSSVDPSNNKEIPDFGSEFEVEIQPGDHLAQLEVETPDASVSHFVLHATLPVTANDYPRADGKAPFAIGENVATALPAQVEIVSRFADDGKGADVVEVIAQVPNIHPNSRVHYGVYGALVNYPKAASNASARQVLMMTNSLPINVRAFLNSGAPLKIIGFDRNNCRYELDLLSGAGGMNIDRNGPAWNTVNTHGYMAPVGSCSAPFVHLLGVQAMISTVTDYDTLLVEIILHNGPAVAPWVGNLFFKAIGFEKPAGLPNIYHEFKRPLARNCTTAKNNEYICPANFEPLIDQINHGTNNDITGGGRCFHDRRDAGNNIIDQNSNGDLHAFPHLGNTIRRMAFSAASDNGAGRRLLDQVGLGFATFGKNSSGVPFFSWWNPGMGRYGGMRMWLPRLDSFNLAGGGISGLQNRFVGEYNSVKGVLTSGCLNNNIAARYNSMGWAQPSEDQNGGTTGGIGIQPFDGGGALTAASRHKVLSFQGYLEMNADRNPRALFENNGEPFDFRRHEMTDSSGLVIRKFKSFLLMPFAGGVLAPAYASGNWANNIGPNDPFANLYPVIAKCFDPSQSCYDASIDPGAYKPAYQRELFGFGPNDWAFQPPDNQHYVRTWRLTQALTWIANDPIAKLLGKLYGAIAMATLDFRPSSTTITNAQGETLAFQAVDIANLDNGSVSLDILKDAQHGSPLTSHAGYLNQGFNMGRGESWETMAAINAYSTQTPAWRSANRRWFDMLSELYIAGISQCSGNIVRQNISKTTTDNNGQPWNMATTWVVQRFEQTFAMIAGVALLQATQQGVSPNRYTRLLNVISQAGFGDYSASWSVPFNAPFYFLGLSPKGDFNNNLNLYNFIAYSGAANLPACTAGNVAADASNPPHTSEPPLYGTNPDQFIETDETPVAAALWYLTSRDSQAVDYLAKMRGVYLSSDSVTTRMQKVLQSIQNSMAVNNIDAFEYSFHMPALAFLQWQLGILDP